MRYVARAAGVVALGAALLAAATRVLVPAEAAVARPVEVARAVAARGVERPAPALAPRVSMPPTGDPPPATVAAVSTAPAAVVATAPAARHGHGVCCAPSESAVTAALRWLARHQEADGGWSARGSGCPGGTCDDGPASATREGVTALALLPFVSAGYSPLTRASYPDRHTGRRTSFGKVMKDALAWLLARQDPRGRIGATPTDHATATWVLLEVQRVAPQAALREGARRALEELVRDGPPLRLAPAFGADDLAAVRAMALASEVDVEVPDATLGPLRAWLDRGPERCAAWLLCAGLLDEVTATPDAEGLAAGLAPPRWGAADVYGWHVSAAALWPRPGPATSAWLDAVKAALTRSQALSAAGCADGSWASLADPASVAGGRVVLTALAAETLVSCHRHAALRDER